MPDKLDQLLAESNATRPRDVVAANYERILAARGMNKTWDQIASALGVTRTGLQTAFDNYVAKRKPVKPQPLRSSMFAQQSPALPAIPAMNASMAIQALENL